MALIKTKQWMPVAVALIVCAATAGFYFGFFQTGNIENLDAGFSQEERELLKTLVLTGSAQVENQLSERYNRIEGAREILGKSREVLTRMGLLNEQVSEKLGSNGIVQGKVEKGDTIAGILEDAGTGSIQQYVNAAAKVFSLRSFKAGQSYTVFTDPDSGRIRRFEYEINDAHRLVIEGIEKPKARIEDIEYITLLDNPKGIIDDNLFQTVADIGENPQLAMRLVELFGSEINFLKDLHQGDKFSVLIEKRFRDGEARGYGRILAARFVNKGKTYEAYLFRDSSGQLHHYNAKGENLKKTLLMAPLAVTRLTSRFSHNRRHPILGGERPHLGVDYAAPVGTPVKAVGHGTVIKRGWGGGYGNQIILQHTSNLESMYAHLSGFARGLKTGQKVRQGQVIGFVGNTGLSTGPHLDFRLRQDGKFINPVKAVNPRNAPVETANMAHFNRVKKMQKAYLDGEKLPENYSPDSIVPARLESYKTPKSGVKPDKAVKSQTRKAAKEKRSAAREIKNPKNKKSKKYVFRQGSKKPRKT